MAPSPVESTSDIILTNSSSVGLCPISKYVILPSKTIRNSSFSKRLDPFLS